jgi:hypothetical protein
VSDEGGFWAVAAPVLIGLGLDPIRCENVVHDGFPDVSYTHGLIELKHLDGWPARALTPVDIGVRRDQAPVLARRWEHGGLAWVLARVGREWLLFDGWTAGTVLRSKPTRMVLYALAAWHGPRGCPPAQHGRLSAWLRGADDEMMPHDRARFWRLLSRKSIPGLARELRWDPAVLSLAEHGSEHTEALLEAWEV